MYNAPIQVQSHSLSLGGLNNGNLLAPNLSVHMQKEHQQKSHG
uniref:Uncharacterized protein n=1 Tax=Rhizophora mucronata TaxID=61149 RepID=A0A2P2PR28_RHIMU